MERPLWADLLSGEELAHLTTEPARDARTAPVPAGLHDSVREALARQGMQIALIWVASTGPRAG